MAHVQKPDLVFQRNGQVHFNWAGGDQFIRLLAAEVCASVVVMLVMLDTPCSEVECKCVTVCHQVSTELYMPLLFSNMCYIKFSLVIEVKLEDSLSHSHEIFFCKKE